MGFSKLRFRNQSYEANDALLQIWLFQMVEAIDSLFDLPVYLQAIRDDWYEQASLEPGFGYVLNLDQHLSTSEQIKILIELSQIVMAKLSAYGPRVSAQQLNQWSHATPSSYFTRDLAIDLLTGIGKDFITLLTQTSPTESQNSGDPEERVP